MDIVQVLDRGPARRAPSDYVLLKRRVLAAGLLEKQPWFSVRSIACKLALLAAALAIVPIFRHQPWIVALDAVVLAVVFGQLGFQLGRVPRLLEKRRHVSACAAHYNTVRHAVSCAR